MQIRLGRNYSQHNLSDLNPIIISFIDFPYEFKQEAHGP